MPNVPPSPCSTLGCPHLRPCPEHLPPSPWSESKARRRARGATLSGSRTQKRNRRIMQRHSTICHVCHEPAADEIDHVVPLCEGGPDTDDNLRPIHSTPCHTTKTNGERTRARARARGDVEAPTPPGVPPRPLTPPGPRGAGAAHADRFRADFPSSDPAEGFHPVTPAEG